MPVAKKNLKLANTKLNKKSAAPLRLRAPRWNAWLARGPMPLRHAALLTMGLAPVAGVIKALLSKPKRLSEFRRRAELLRLAHVQEQFSIEPFLPRTVTALEALEFAAKSGWELNKGVVAALERARFDQQRKAKAAATSTAIGPRPTTFVVELDPKSSEPEPEQAEARAPSKTPLSKGDATLRVIVGAMAVVIRDLSRSGPVSRLTNSFGHLNVSQLAEDITKIIDKEDLRGGFGKSNISQLIGKTLKEFPKTHGGPPTSWVTDLASEERQ